MPLFMGSLYIEMDSYAITEAEFGFNLSNKEAASINFYQEETSWNESNSGNCNLQNQIP